jgi:hypothetical protein
MMLPGKMMELVSATGMMIMVVTMWQKGISQASSVSWSNDMEPRALTRLTINVRAKNKASAINPIAL